MSGSIPFIPSSLPSEVYEQAAGIHTQMTGDALHSTGSFNPSGTTGLNNQIHSQNTGGSNVTLASPNAPRRQAPSTAGASAFSTDHMNTVHGSGFPWAITTSEKAKFDGWFDALDNQKQGYIEGDVAVPFMLESRLLGDDLAQIW